MHLVGGKLPEPFERPSGNLDEVVKEYNFSLRASKCQFAMTQVDCLGHTLSAAGIKPSRKKVAAIAEMEFPKDKTELKSFLGSAGYYRRFVKDFAGRAYPLTRLLKKDVPFPLQPTQEQAEAFTALKEALTEDCMLHHPCWDDPMVIHCDASIKGLGAVLLNSSKDGGRGCGRVLQYASRALTASEAIISKRSKNSKARHRKPRKKKGKRSGHSKLNWGSSANAGWWRTYQAKTSHSCSRVCIRKTDWRRIF